MNILKLIKDELKIDFTSTFIVFDSGTGSDNPFELSARDFLRFAKSDFKSNDKKGNINALTNSKRAIDCQIDLALTLFGIQYDKISNSSNKIIELTGLMYVDLSHKLKLIQALDFAPSGLISKTRTLRNKLEHYYQIPNKEEVKEAIELAELFVLSIESHIKMIANSFNITDKAKYNDNIYINNCVRVDFNNEVKEINLGFYKEREKIADVSLNENDEIFYVLIKLINNIHEQIEMEDALKIFLKFIEHPIPERNVNLELR